MPDRPAPGAGAASVPKSVGRETRPASERGRGAGRDPKNADRGHPTDRDRPADAERRQRPSDRVRRRRTLVKVGLAGLLLVGFLFVFVYPTRTFLQQRNQKNDAEHQLEVLHQQTEKLKEQTKKLGTDAEVERIARERFGLVRPGETPYVPIPVPPSTQPPTVATAPAGSQP
ncbi:MAG TPA: septum formation initiator family protein [Acidimicrobiia bacterium]|nr:septum formation initiator family protein [Acidimicrobiia bacterium]